MNLGHLHELNEGPSAQLEFEFGPGEVHVLV